MSSGGLTKPPSWTSQELEASRLQAIEEFRKNRMEEPLEAYLEVFEDRQNTFEDFLETTVDLTQLSDHAIEVLTDAKFLEALRYIAGPPISLDDLKVVSNVPSFTAAKLTADPQLAQRIIDTVMLGLDRQRFPWIHENREEITDEERRAAVLASAALIASQRVTTQRKHESKTAQENKVEENLLSWGFQKVPTRTVSTSAEAPASGTFCRESILAGRKADVLVGLWDHRLMPIECKVSNSATNSIKRLNNDAAVKAVQWRKALGDSNVVPTAVLSGVYKLKNLVDAQEQGLTLFWAHDLERMRQWIEATKP